MKLLRHLSECSRLPEGSVATIGNFDGVHLGHQCVMQQVKAKAAELALPSVVIGFEPLPAEYFASATQQPPLRIYPLRDKIRRLQALGLDYFVRIPFDQSLAMMSPEAFVQRWLWQTLQVCYLVVGDDFRFGYKRQGDFTLLQHMGAQQGMQVVDTPTYAMSGERVSSTRIREALMQADLAGAAQLLGVPYEISGRVRHGDKRGRTLGFPTLNIRAPAHLALRNGVYAVEVRGLGQQVLMGVGNLGSRPTVNGLETRFEVHLFDFSSQVYQQSVCIRPMKFIRPEQRFDSLDALKAQIQSDVAQVKALF